MLKKVKDFDSFHTNQKEFEAEINEDFNLGSMFSSVGNFFAGGLAPMVKRKLTEFLMAKIGILPDTLASYIVQNVVKLIPVKDYPGIFTGSKLNAAYLTPLFAEATAQMIADKGVDGVLAPVAEKLGLDPKGWLFIWIKESILQAQSDRNGFVKSIENFYKFLGSIEISAGEFASTIDKKDGKKIASGIEKQLAIKNPSLARDAKEAGEEGGLSGFFSKIASTFSKDEIKHY
jgi:hypothetical protein